MTVFESKRVSQIANESSQSDEDHRAHQRHTLADKKLCFLAFEGGLKGTIRNLSYSGISVEFEQGDMKQVTKQFNDSKKVEDSQTWEARLCMGYEFTRTKVALVRRIGRHVAFEFIHDLAETLIFLREVLEPMRIGSTLTPYYGFDSNQWKDRRFTLKGDALSELNFMIDEIGNLLFSRLTYSSQGYIYEVTFQEQKIETGVAVINFGSAATQSHSSVLDVRLLRQSVFLLFGLQNEAITEQKHQLATEIIKVLSQNVDKSRQDPAA